LTSLSDFLGCASREGEEPGASLSPGGPGDASPSLEAWPDRLPPHLSVTQVRMFERCPEQYRRRYVLGHKEPPRGHLIWGGADHKTFEYNFAQKIETGADLPRSELIDLFSHHVDTLIDEAGEVDWGKSSRDETLTRGAGLVAAYRDDVAPRVQPVAVEREISLDVGLPVPLLGYIDVETEGGLIERKTASRRPSGLGQDWVLQARCYQLAVPKTVDWHVSVKTASPSIVAEGLTLTPDGEDAVRVRSYLSVTARAILSYYETFGPDDPWPGARGIDRSPCGWCGFRSSCDWWRS